jgi:IMP cyclohydrolase
MGPVGNAPYDPLRHYSAIKYDDVTGVLAVTNGIQTEAIYETYKLMINTGSNPGRDYIEKIMDGAGAEPDSYHTPRIAGVVTPAEGNSGMKFTIAMKGFNLPAKSWEVKLQPGVLTGISTYNGVMDKPAARDPGSNLPLLECQLNTAAEIGNFIFDISAADYQGNDIRVCTVAGVYSNNRKWELAVRNVH